MTMLDVLQIFSVLVAANALGLIFMSRRNGGSLLGLLTTKIEDMERRRK